MTVCSGKLWSVCRQAYEPHAMPPFHCELLPPRFIILNIEFSPPGEGSSLRPLRIPRGSRWGVRAKATHSHWPDPASSVLGAACETPKPQTYGKTHAVRHRAAAMTLSGPLSMAAHDREATSGLQGSTRSRKRLAAPVNSRPLRRPRLPYFEVAESASPLVSPCPESYPESWHRSSCTLH